MRDIEHTPGPGYYNIPCKFADVPKYLLPPELNSTSQF